MNGNFRIEKNNNVENLFDEFISRLDKVKEKIGKLEDELIENI